MKKLIALLLCFCSVLSIGFSVSVQASSYAGNCGELLYALGLLDEVKYDTAAEDDTENTFVTRAEALDGVLKVLGISVDSNRKITYFKDVELDNIYLEAVNTAAELGIINGTGNTLFAPDRAITKAELAKIIVTASEYRYFMRNADYLSFAVEQGFFNGVTSAEHLRFEEYYRVLYNLLTSDACVAGGVENGQVLYKRKSGVDFLEEIYKITVYRGRVTATSFASLNGQKPLANGKIAVDHTSYSISDNAFNNLIGQKVAYWVLNDNGDQTVLYMQSIEKNSLEISGKDVYGISENGTELKYEENGKIKTVSLDPYVDIIYNGEYLYSKDKSVFENVNGCILLIETDNRYDVAVITDYRTIVGDRLDSYDEKIYDKYSSQYLDMSGDTYEYLSVYKGRKEMRFADIERNMVLSVAEGQKDSICRVLVSDKSFDGNVTGLGDDFIEIDGKSYDYTDEFQSGSDFSSIVLGQHATFYLDVHDTIAAMNSAADEEKYGFLLGVEKEGILDGTAKFQIYTEDDETVILETADRLKIYNRNGTEEHLKKSEVGETNCFFDENGSIVQQMIRYKLNNQGLLSEIRFAKESNDFSDETGTFTLSVKDGYGEWNENSATFATGNPAWGLYRIDSETKLFFVDTSGDVVSEDDVKVLNSGLVHNREYQYQIYDLKAAMVCGAVLINSSAQYNNFDQYAAAVSDVRKGLDDEGNIITFMSCWHRGTLKKFYLDEELDTSMLQSGDILKLSMLGDEVKEFDRLFTMGEKKFENELSYGNYGRRGTYRAGIYVVYGRIYANENGGFSIKTADGEVIEPHSILNTTKVYSIERCGGKITVNSGSVSQLMASGIGGMDGSQVVLSKYNAVLRDLIIISD